ncbi:hypothetical protein BpHYR1_052076 [Brachionus plicatilis]|uniref:Uncharacterized protein n=1 Tax=Brachionus plicatilis TaxID=10195 RepID=A0A3M7R8U0_BRAPC|nr:hypothetical protein BpHYR1_052076 [Brachionus plicatilis]
MSALKIVLLYGNIDLIHELDQKDFCRITGSNELVNYLTFDGNYYDSEEEMDEDDDEDDEEEMEYNSDASESDEEKDNYDRV